MKHIFITICAIPVIALLFIQFKPADTEAHKPEPVLEQEVQVPEETHYNITGIVQSRDTMNAIFKRHKLDFIELSRILKTSRDIYNLSRLSVGNVYSFKMDKEQKVIQNMRYGIDDSSFLNITKSDEGYVAEKVAIEPIKKIGALYINIQDNLIMSMPGRHREYMKIALDLSDIYAWDIDFSNDIRNGDSLKVLVEELWVGEVFKGFGSILAAEFINNGKPYLAFRYEFEGETGYYDENGRSLKKALMKSPLKFTYISSRFSRSRMHPILRYARPHLGVDYAAPRGTPVSAAGGGTIKFAGYKGQNGKMVRIKHKGGYETYYGHLSRIPRNIKKGTKVSQGEIIGYVGSTGLSTGPHLDYRVKRNGTFINPLTLRLPRGVSVPDRLMADFRSLTESFGSRLASLTQPIMAFKANKKTAS